MPTADFKQKIYKIFIAVFKNLLVFLVGAFLGLAGTILFAEPLLSHTISKDMGLGVLAIAPALIIIYGVIFCAAGGMIAVILYNLSRWLKKRRAASKSDIYKKDAT